MLGMGAPGDGNGRDAKGEKLSPPLKLTCLTVTCGCAAALHTRRESARG